MTPLPWQVSGNHEYADIIGPCNENVTINAGGCASMETEDAEFAVHAANCHEALLVACHAAMSFIPGSEIRSWPPGFKLKDDALRLLRAAIALAEKR